MESQNEENPVGSSSSTFPRESESQLPMQVDEVTTEVIDETGKRKLISDAWKHFKPVMINRVRFGVSLASMVDKVSCPILLDEEEEPDSSWLTGR
ncbi:uncharacterized protein [Nicotiana tomentosiformis]|uniref:uncharacterized protein isoform X2 n=1 Tax=Nicotiana tomentosiformis TaxID=4098 RepID=UPI00144624A9|nr:uncharacterized protein LOC104095692 isoform X3 [Nicotiana tomentosiformis]